VKLWRLLPKRSAARMTNAVLRGAWVDGPRSYVLLRARVHFTGAPHLLAPILVSIVALAPPFIAGIGHPTPGWLSDAWQVTGVLIGFALALFVFLMEALVDRSLRSRATFRTVIREAGLEWPLGLGLAFIAYAAAASRWSGEVSKTAAWAETWLLFVFVLQIASFAWVFVRGIKLTPPSALTDMIRRSFRDAAHEAARRQLQRRVSSNLIDAACKDAAADADMPEAISHSPIAFSGSPVEAKRTGEIRDVDVGVAKRLASLRPAGKISLTASIVSQVEPGVEIGRLENLGPFFATELRRSVAIGKRSEDLETQQIFREAIDFARRAHASKSAADLDLALDVIVDAFTEVARSWSAFGIRYETGQVGEIFRISDGDQMYWDLRDLSIDFVNDGDPRFIQALSTLSYRLIIAGYEQDAPLLAEHGEALSVGQTSLLR